jgi:hypothetical protein
MTAPYVEVIETCPRCEGKGKLENALFRGRLMICSTCKGPGKVTRNYAPKHAKAVAWLAAQQGSSQASAPSNAPERKERSPWWPFKSKTEFNYAEKLKREKDDGSVQDWKYEKLTISLQDGSGERYTPDFLVKRYGVWEAVEIKPFSWTPKEGRIGMSKMKRGAMQLKELFGMTLYKGSYNKGVWWHDEIS